MHAGGGGQVAIWTEPTELICQVSDAGHITDPLAAGPAPAAVGARSGARQRHLRPGAYPHSTGRTTIRLHFAT